MLAKSKILVVNDSPDLIDFLTTFLEMNSCEVLGVISKKLLHSTLIYFQPDLFILDANLHSYDVVLKFVKNLRKIKCIITYRLSSCQQIMKG